MLFDFFYSCIANTKLTPGSNIFPHIKNKHLRYPTSYFFFLFCFLKALDASAGGKLDDDAGWNMIKGDAKAAAITETVAGLAKGDITEAFTMTSSFPKPAFATVSYSWKKEKNP